MAFLYGDHEHTIDAKRRLPITSALRELIDPEEDGGDFILFLGPDRHLWLYPDKYYTRLAATMKRSPLPSRDHRKIALYFAMARRLKCDGQGRVVLPEKSMQRAVISNRVTLVGVGDHIEVWPTEEWNTRVENELPNLGEELYEAEQKLARQGGQSEYATGPSQAVPGTSGPR